MRTQRGITLISLVITIIVMLILAAVSLSTVVGEGGILNRAISAKDKTEEAAKKEEDALYKMDEYIDDKSYTGVIISNQERLNEAIANVQDGEVIRVSANTFTLNTLNKNMTIRGTEGTIIDMMNDVSLSGTQITVKKAILKYSNGANYKGMKNSSKEVYENCTIEGTMFANAPEVEFKRCTFVNTVEEYNIWTYYSNVTFENCTFNCNGKSVLVYNEGGQDIEKTITFNNCVFNDNGDNSIVKAAVETGDSPAGNNKYNLIFNKCKVNGFANNDAGIFTGTTLYGNKNSMDKDHLNVIIDGVDVY